MNVSILLSNGAVWQLRSSVRQLQRDFLSAKSVACKTRSYLIFSWFPGCRVARPVATTANPSSPPPAAEWLLWSSATTRRIPTTTVWSRPPAASGTSPSLCCPPATAVPYSSPVWPHPPTAYGTSPGFCCTPTTATSHATKTGKASFKHVKLDHNYIVISSYIILIASFSGATQLSVACHTNSDGKLAGPRNEAIKMI